MVLNDGYGGGPINFLICVTCLGLLFFESAFGICVGCKIYNLLNTEKALLCPGGVCAMEETQPIQQVSKTQVAVLTATLVGLVFLASRLPEPNVQSINNNVDCGAIPEHVNLIGHEEKWRLHHQCK